VSNEVSLIGSSLLLDFFSFSELEESLGRFGLQLIKVINSKMQNEVYFLINIILSINFKIQVGFKGFAQRRAFAQFGYLLLSQPGVVAH